MVEFYDDPKNKAPERLGLLVTGISRADEYAKRVHGKEWAGFETLIPMLAGELEL